MAPTVLPSSVLGKDGAVAPSERIILGGIGLRSRGAFVLRHFLREEDVHFVAICDSNKSQREEIKRLVDARYDNEDCALYPEINEFLAERTDIDALLIATGDRWHALAAIMAMRAGKDVFSEKPSSMTIEEGQVVVETARQFARVYQTGVQRINEANFLFANEVARLGLLGNVHTTHAHIAPWDAAVMRHDWLPEQPEPPIEEMDWDAWLGPCPWRPFNVEYVQGRWRGHYDFHTSCIGEWGAHTFAQCQDAIGARNTSATHYQYVDNPTGDGMETTFANGVKMVLQLEGWRGSCGVRYEGDEGWVSVADGYEKPDVYPESLLDQFDKIVDNHIARTQRPVRHTFGHVRDFLDCVKSRRPAATDAELMHRSMTTVHAANICMWLQRDMRFDPVREEFIDDPEANRFRSRAQREPWIL